MGRVLSKWWGLSSTNHGAQAQKGILTEASEENIFCHSLRLFAFSKHWLLFLGNRAITHRRRRTRCGFAAEVKPLQVAVRSLPLPGGLWVSGLPSTGFGTPYFSCSPCFSMIVNLEHRKGRTSVRIPAPGLEWTLGARPRRLSHPDTLRGSPHLCLRQAASLLCSASSPCKTRPLVCGRRSTPTFSEATTRWRREGRKTLTQLS